jgi:hypothetical protein
MPYWSITCYACNEVPVPEAGQLLEPGLNVFTVVLDDLDPLLARLGSEGVTQITSIRLDDPEEAADVAGYLAEGP